MHSSIFPIRLFFMALSCALLISCGGSGDVRPLQSQPVEDNPNPQTAPLVNIKFEGYDPESTVLRFSEGQTVTFQLDPIGSTITNASLSQTTGPRANFGLMSARGTDTDGDLNVGDGINDVRFSLFDLSLIHI